MAAFDAGRASGADGLELDVRLSSDGKVVVHHDNLLDRTTNLTGPISRRSADELAQADAAFHYGAERSFPFRGRGIGVPALADVLARYQDVPVIIEVKVNTIEMARAVLDAVRAAGAVDRVCVGSFGRRVLRAIRSMEPRVATSASREEVRLALYRTWCRWPVSTPPYSGYQVPEKAGSTRVVSPRFVEYAHRAQLGVQVWTVDTADDAARLLGWGVDALITDNPSLIVPLCTNQR
jgi:glycerophosphoryl diester phosphodiesterase